MVLHFHLAGEVFREVHSPATLRVLIKRFIRHGTIAHKKNGYFLIGQ